jgi:hypothetical protein
MPEQECLPEQGEQMFSTRLHPCDSTSRQAALCSGFRRRPAG